MKKTFLATVLSLSLKKRDPTPSGKLKSSPSMVIIPPLSREEQEKVNLVWHDDGTISYNRRRYWYFEPDLPVGPLNDTVVELMKSGTNNLIVHCFRDHPGQVRCCSPIG